MLRGHCEFDAHPSEGPSKGEDGRCEPNLAVVGDKVILSMKDLVLVDGGKAPRNEECAEALGERMGPDCLGSRGAQGLPEPNGSHDSLRHEDEEASAKEERMVTEQRT